MVWGPGATGGFQNALAMGMQMGQQARMAQQQNALMQQREAMIANQTRDQQMQEQRFAQQQQQEAQTSELTAKALQGDDAALSQLATVNFDRWKTLDTQLKGRAAEEAQVLGNAAIDLLNVPFEQRSGQIIAYAQRFPEFADKINEVAYLPQGEQDAALRTVVAEAKMIDKLIQMERPQAFNVGPGEGRYERNPVTGQITTVVQPNYGGAPAFSPVPQGGGGRTVTRTGRDANGRRVVQYSDGTIEYAAD